MHFHLGRYLKQTRAKAALQVIRPPRIVPQPPKRIRLSLCRTGKIHTFTWDESSKEYAEKVEKAEDYDYIGKSISKEEAFKGYDFDKGRDPKKS